MRLKDVARARSGDKGSSVNIGVIANTLEAYETLEKSLTADVVGTFFSHPPQKIKRYLWPSILAINFVIEEILDPLSPDNQGKAFATAFVELELEDHVY